MSVQYYLLAYRYSSTCHLLKLSSSFQCQNMQVDMIQPVVYMWAFPPPLAFTISQVSFGSKACSLLLQNRFCLCVYKPLCHISLTISLPFRLIYIRNLLRSATGFPFRQSYNSNKKRGMHVMFFLLLRCLGSFSSEMEFIAFIVLD